MDGAIMINAVRKVLEDNLWYIATYDKEPNVVPVGFKCVTDDGKLHIAVVLLETTVNNIKKNGKVAIAACNVETMEAYQIKGRAEFIMEGVVYDSFVKLAEDTFHGAFYTKCEICVTPERIIVSSANSDNKKELELETV